MLVTEISGIEFLELLSVMDVRPPKSCPSMLHMFSDSGPVPFNRRIAKASLQDHFLDRVTQRSWGEFHTLHLRHPCFIAA
jgi:hypothetical protein